MVHTVKKILAKTCQEMHLKWDQALSIAFLQIGVALRGGLELSPFRMVHGRPFQVSVLRMPHPRDLEHKSRLSNMYNI